MLWLRLSLFHSCLSFAWNLRGRCYSPLGHFPTSPSPVNPKKSHLSPLTVKSVAVDTPLRPRGTATTWGQPHPFRPKHRVTGPRATGLLSAAGWAWAAQVRGVGSSLLSPVTAALSRLSRTGPNGARTLQADLS